MMTRKQSYRLLVVVTAAIFTFINPISTVLAVDAFDEQFYSSNNILFYDPRAGDCSATQSADSVLVGGDNLEKIFNFFTGKGLSPEQAAGIVGNISQESGGNPLNAQKGPDTDDPSKITGPVGGGNAWGIIQWDAGNRAVEYAKKANITTPIGDLSTQLELVWWHMNNETPTSAQNMLAEYKTITNIDEATNVYEKRMTGAGTPVMTNRITAANLAFKLYGANTGSGATPSSSGNAGASACSGNSGGAGLASGGMSLQQAQAFMKEYKDLAIKYADKRIADIFTIPEHNVKVYGAVSCSGSAIANCSSFSEFFVGKYTTGDQAFPNGKDMVRQLLASNSGFTNGGKTPKTYAVFSRQSGGQGAGHTGIVLGVSENTGKMIIGEASCGGGIDGITAKEVSISSYSTSDYSYAYTDSILKSEGGLSI